MKLKSMSAALFAAMLSLTLAGFSCSHEKDAAPQAQSTPAQSTPASAKDAITPVLNFPPDSGSPPAIDGDRTMQYVKDVVKFGERPIGSANHKKLEDYILAHLKGDDVESDSFEADTVAGKFPVHNIIAKFPGEKDGIIVIAGHYDTNLPLKGTGYVGANDGGSTTAILLEFANQLRGKKRDGYSVWLVWTDAEEAVQKWSAEDSLYGTKHLAARWQQDGTAKKIKAFLLTDMIGDADLDIDRDQNSTQWLEDVVYEAAKRLGYQSHFFERDNAIEDDHLPFVKIGIPCADIIDIDYGYNGVFHHTPQDTVDKLSAKSLSIVGGVVLETVRILDTMEPLPPK
jgi:glutaminyl-peptide cyclotransferase